MCGISAITGVENIVPSLYESIRSMEYRGYDSCGLGLIDKEEIQIRKNIGGVEEVNQKEQFSTMAGKIGIGHTRWATHGGVSQANAHPHLSYDARFALVHNGIIANHQDLKEKLKAHGISFVSDTDTEVIAHLLAFHYAQSKTVEQAFLATLNEMEGHYALAMLTALQSETLYCARQGSPLVLGIGENCLFAASDMNAFLPHTRKAVLMEDGEYAILEPKTHHLRKIQSGQPVHREIFHIEWSLEIARKGGYAHYMLKEIFEQPQTLQHALNCPKKDISTLAQWIAEARTAYLMGVGTTHYVAMFGQYMFAELAQIFLPAVSADEFKQIATPGPEDLLIAISQSGETFDTRQSTRFAKERKARTACIVNVIGSSLSMMSDHVIFQGSGPEICVVSTKAALAQMLILLQIALEVGEANHTLSPEQRQIFQAELEAFPPLAEKSLNEASGAVRNFAKRNAHFTNWLFLGRGAYHAIAMEAALKMKEVTYHHVEGLSAGFLKHGTLAMVDPNLASVFFVPPPENQELYELTCSAIQEVKARGGPCLGLVFEHSKEAIALLDDAIILPRTSPQTAPFMQLIIAQLFAYFSAHTLGRNIDKPRNLAKSVTVE